MNTKINKHNLAQHLKQYNLGKLLDYKPLLGGTVNSNYLIITAKGQWVFTILEHMNHALAQQISLFLVFLNEHDFPTPRVQIPLSGDATPYFQEKPSIVVTYLEGASPVQPTPKQCHQVGSALAKLHVLTQGYITPLINTMDNAWRNATARTLRSRFTKPEQTIIQAVLQEQAKMPYTQLPHGIGHYDLFKDNTLFREDNLNGIIDFYYACYDSLLMDLSICLNDWCTHWSDKEGILQAENHKALMRGYESIRPLSDMEHQMLPAMLRVAALHFWMARMQSRALNLHQTGTPKVLKDPNEYKAILMARLDQPI